MKNKILYCRYYTDNRVRNRKILNRIYYKLINPNGQVIAS
jgi:hypothetical protein